MKKIYILLLTIVGFSFSSCDLNEQPYGFYSDKNFYKTPEDAEVALLYAYNSLNFIEYSRGIFYIGELASDNCTVKPEEGNGAQELDSWSADAGNETLGNYFKYCYIAINRANAVIENVENSGFDKAIEDKLLGEAYFLRAYSYFNLARNFGLVPLQKQMVSMVSHLSPTMAKSMDEVYDFIIADLKTAESKLKINKCVGRADQVAVQSLLAKVYLTIASSKESNVEHYKDMSINVADAYTQASTYAHKVLYDQSKYKLDENLMHVYDITAPNGSEHIFIMSMDRSGLNEGNYSKIGKLFHVWDDAPSYYLVNPDNTFTHAHNGWEVFQTTNELYSSFTTGDKRKSDLIVNAIYTKDGNKIKDVSKPFTRKYVDPNFIGDKSSAKPFLIRFSDIALVYAEAQGPTTEGYKWVNEIRSRAGIVNLPAGLNAADFRNRIIQERAWELAFEGHRLYDLRRKAIVTQKDPKASGITEAKAAFYPIPQREIDLNPNL